MIRKLPIIATIIVLAAVATMIALGLWQLGRLEEKEALLASYNATDRDAPVVELPGSGDAERYAYRKVSGTCTAIGDVQLVAGHNAQGETGWAQVAVCRLFGFDWGGSYAVVLGWSSEVAPLKYSGGEFSGTLVPFRKSSVSQPEEVNRGYDKFSNMDYHIIADPPLAGLEANAAPDPNDIPNNHLSYAIQWFFFAVTALVIYALALRKRLAGDGPPR
jgi:surfeit locus 1 family protein